MYTLEFERPIREIKSRIDELSKLTEDSDIPVKEIEALEKNLQTITRNIYTHLTPWQKTQIARHPKRLSFQEFLSFCCDDFIELHGDRCFGDDPALLGGIGRLNTIPFMLLGTQKGCNTQDNMKRNFGMPKPEGYRKALRLMKLAARFGLPIVTFIDTPGAYPGIDAEERGQSEAIAKNLMEMSDLSSIIISIIIGEGGSGGALALAVGNKVLMFEHAIYSVISPEGCASILWQDATKAEKAAEILRYTAHHLTKLEIIDDIITEPLGGCHNDNQQASQNLLQSILKYYQQLSTLSCAELIEQRYNRFRKFGVYMSD